MKLSWVYVSFGGGVLRNPDIVIYIWSEYRSDNIYIAPEVFLPQMKVVHNRTNDPFNSFNKILVYVFVTNITTSTSTSWVL